MERRKPRLNSSAAITILIISVLLVVSLVAVLVYDGIVGASVSRDEQEYIEQIAPLLLRKTSLEDSLKDMEREYMAAAPCGANISLLFVDLDAPLYDTIYPLVMQREGVSGIICLSMTELPNLEGKITGEQLNEMLLAGWTLAFYWDGEGDLDAHLATAEDRLASLGLPMTDTVVFERFVYDEKYDATLTAHGVEFAMKYDLGVSLLLDKGVDGEIMHPGIVGWNVSGYGREFLESAKTELGVAAFAVSFDDDDPGRYLNPEAEEYIFYFERMLDAIADNVSKGAVTCTSLAEAYENRRGYVEAWNAMEESLGGAKRQILDEIAAIERQIIDIRKKYDR